LAIVESKKREFVDGNTLVVEKVYESLRLFPCRFMRDYVG